MPWLAAAVMSRDGWLVATVVAAGTAKCAAHTRSRVTVFGLVATVGAAGTAWLISRNGLLTKAHDA